MLRRRAMDCHTTCVGWTPVTSPPPNRSGGVPRPRPAATAQRECPVTDRDHADPEHLPDPEHHVDPLADRNHVVLIGTVRAEPAWFERAEGHACCFELEADPEAQAVRTRVPVAWLDPPRKGSIVRAGRRLVVLGQLHQRFFQAQGRTMARLEVVAAQVVPVRNRARAEAAVRAATG